MFELLVATKNAGKIREIAELLADAPIAVRSLREFAELSAPEETGATFAENAVLKARYYAEATKIPALADDSGLEVAALGGAPGVYSARYAGANATDAERIAKLLGELRAAREPNRAARFVCAMALIDETGESRCLAEGVCDGRIAESAAGANGFGYDPVFVPEGFSRTFGELPAQIKRKISHRARATSKIVAFLRDSIVV